MTEKTTRQLGNPQPRAESDSWSGSRRSFRDTRAPRTAWRAPAGLLLLALAAVLVLPAPAQAATQVSNLGQATDTVTMDASWEPEGQGFTTGTHPAGYSLTSVQLHIDSFVSPATITDMNITLRTRATGSVSRPVFTDTATFSNPTFSSAGTYTFTLPTNTTIDLTAETDYFVVIDINNSDGDSGVVLGNTTVTDEDSDAATGWEIHDDSYWPDGFAWISNDYMYRIAVNATKKNTPATGRPTITGTAAAVGDVLTAVTTGIADADGLTSVSYSYQWIRVDDMAVETDISSATSSTYTLVAADVGKHFKVKVTFEDDGGFDEELTSKLHPARTGGICARTEQVRDAIVAATAATTCANVTTTHLSGLGILDLSNRSISSLQSGDFAGLTGLTRLWLRNNALSSLPANIFDGLTVLNWLRLSGNALSSLPSGLFTGLTALRQLDLSGNALSSLPSGLFAGLTALERLTLQNNPLSSLPSGLFAGLTALRTLTLSDNALTLSGLPAGLFAGLTALENLVLADNDTLTGLPAGLFTGLTALDDLNLASNALSSLPAGIFDGLAELATLRLNHNELTSLPANIFQDLTTLSTLRLQGNSNTDSFAPTAEAGEAQMVSTDAAVTLAGSSTGPWGTNVTYAWTQTSGTTVTLTGDDTATPSFTAPSTAGDLVFTLTVTGRPASAAGTATGTDTITVTVTDPATLATLSDLTLSDGTLDPEFDTATDTYTASVLNGVTTLTVTPTPSGSNATVEYLDDSDDAITDTDLNTPGLQMALAANLAATTHVIKVKVTAETGTPKATKTYTVTVTKEASDVQLPGAPTGLTATPADKPTQIDLDWTAPTNDGNSDLTGYRIEVSPDGSNGSWTDLEVNTDNTDTTYAHTGLAPGDTRHYRVSARNALGPGNPSTSDSATTLSGGICARTAQVRDAIVAATAATTCANVTPTHLTSLNGGLDLESKDIRSLKPGDFAGLTNLFRLTLERNALTELPAGIFDPLTALEWLDLSGNALTSLPANIFRNLTALKFLFLPNNALTSLPAGIFDRLIALQTLNLAGNDLTGLPSGIFDRLTALDELALSDNDLTELPRGIFDRLTALTFLGLENNAQSSLPRGIFDRLTALEFLLLCDNPLTELALPSILYDRFITTPPNTKICLPDNVRVRRAASGTSGTSPTTPGEPQNLSGVPGDGQVTLTWEAPSSDGGSAVTGYQYEIDGSETWLDADLDLEQTVPLEQTVTGLTNGQEYAFAVRAVNAVGPGPAAIVTATPVTTPGMPQNLTWEPGDGQVTLTWEAPSSDGGSAITRYEYEIDASGTWLDADLDLEQTVTGLTNGQEYAFAVRAVNASGPGQAASETVTPATTPGAPQNLMSRPGNGQVTLTWEAPSSDGGSGITGYQYEIDDSGIWLDAGPATARGVTVTGLDNGRQYTVAVRAVNTAGSGDEATATVTLVNVDPLLRAWLSRFGRTVATHVTDTVGERMRDTAAPSSHVTVGGYRLPLGTRGADPAGPEVDPRSPGKKKRPDATKAGALRLSMGTESGSAGEPNGTGPGPGDLGMDPWADRPGPDPRVGQTQTLRLRDLLRGSSFRLMLGGDDARPGAMRLTAWGRVAGTQFNGRDRDVALDGDVITGTLGVDSEWERWLAGVAVSHSRGDGAYTIAGNGGDGELENALTSIHPYLRYAVTERLDVWGVLGYGWGDMTMEPGTGRTLETDTTLLMGAFGGRGILLSAPDNAGFQLATRTDAMLTRTTSDAVTTGDGKLASTEADAHRLRLVLEGTREVMWPEGQRVTPAVEIGLRHDWGDAETGFGLEVGGRVQYADPGLGLTIEGAVRALLAHEDSDYKEWGASGTVRLAPGPAGQGLALTISPAWGAASSGVNGLWSRQTTAGLAQTTQQQPTARLNAEVGYGVVVFDKGLLTPYAGTVLTDGAARTYRLGTRWTSLSGLALTLEGTRQEPAGPQPVNQGLQLQVGWGF